MSSIISYPSNSRAAQSLVVGTVIAAAAAASIIYIHAARRRRREWPPPSSDDDGEARRRSGGGPADSADFYSRLGVSPENIPSHIRREIHKERQRKAKAELISMKTPMYDNVYMLDRDRDLMCTISLKKARWYVNKGIAEWSSFKDGGAEGVVPEGGEADATCIRLLFEHNGSSADKSADETLYLRSAKQNVCVACGDDGHHMRHYVVPYAYRALLPEEYKSHMSHDVVIMCPDCHVDCERRTKRRMRQMEDELRMKLGANALEASPVVDDPRLYHIRSCAIALARWKDQMPAETIAGHEREVREYLAGECANEEERDALRSGAEELTKSQLQRACGIRYRSKNPDYVPGSELVVRSLEDARAIEEFIVDWRKHFLAVANPRHMPAGWRVDNPVVCGRGKADGGDIAKSW
ncbi:hypothetical protein ACHAWF_014225 [Thalassiosira exigua]